MRNATPNKVKALESDVEGLKTAIAMVRSDHDELSSKLDTILLQLTALQDGRATEERDASLVALMAPMGLLPGRNVRRRTEPRAGAGEAAGAQHLSATNPFRRQEVVAKRNRSQFASAHTCQARPS